MYIATRRRHNRLELFLFQLYMRFGGRLLMLRRYTSMMDFSIKTLQIMTRWGQLKPVKVDPLEKCRKYDEHCKHWIDYRILRLVLMEQKGGDPDHRLPYKCDESLSLNERQHFHIETLLQYFF